MGFLFLSDIDLITETAQRDKQAGSIYSVDTLNRGMIRIPGSEKHEISSHYAKCAHRLKLLNCWFLGFSI